MSIRTAQLAALLSCAILAAGLGAAAANAEPEPEPGWLKQEKQLAQDAAGTYRVSYSDGTVQTWHVEVPPGGRDLGVTQDPAAPIWGAKQVLAITYQAGGVRWEVNIPNPEAARPSSDQPDQWVQTSTKYSWDTASGAGTVYALMQNCYRPPSVTGGAPCNLRNDTVSTFTTAKTG